MILRSLTIDLKTRSEKGELTRGGLLRIDDFLEFFHGEGALVAPLKVLTLVFNPVLAFQKLLLDLTHLAFIVLFSYLSHNPDMVPLDPETVLSEQLDQIAYFQLLFVLEIGR